MTGSSAVEFFRCFTFDVLPPNSLLPGATNTDSVTNGSEFITATVDALVSTKTPFHQRDVKKVLAPVAFTCATYVGFTGRSSSVVAIPCFSLLAILFELRNWEGSEME